MLNSKLLNAHKILMLSSCKDFTCKMFQYMNSTSYILGEHHKLIFDALDKVVKGDTRKLMINIGPRYGKTLLASQMFIAYGLALNPQAKFLHLSYSGELTQENSIAVRDILGSEYFFNLFDAKIKYGDNKKSKWSTEQGGGMYATSTLGQITGFGAGRVEKDGDTYNLEEIDEFTAKFNPDCFAGAIVIDDPIRPEDALSDNIREQVNRRFETTIRNRVNSRKTPIIIIMQRLHEHDLCGYLQEVEPDEWTILSIPVIQYDENGMEKALWPYKHTLKELHRMDEINTFVFQTQYMQNPKPMEGLLYRPFKTYEIIPADGKGIACNYTDSADTGEDYLCSICYIEREDGNYVTDVLYTKKPMEYTEPALSAMLTINKIEHCTIESNNGGRIFRRNVERISRSEGNPKTVFHDLTQNENKQVRLFTKANEVNNMTFFPVDWEKRWPEFANHIKSFRRVGKNAHDDAEDSLTGCYEMRGNYSEIIRDSDLLRDLL